MCDVYRIFVRDWEECLDFSEEMMLELYLQESYGGEISEKNGYYHGKKWLNVQVTVWKEDIDSGYLMRRELYDDETFPHWWLDRIFGGR